MPSENAAGENAPSCVRAIGWQGRLRMFVLFAKPGPRDPLCVGSDLLQLSSTV